MDPIDYFFMEEFIFPEEGGVTGQRTVPCPHCETEFDLEVDVGNTADIYQCSHCHQVFSVNWPEGVVTAIDDELDDEQTTED